MVAIRLLVICIIIIVLAVSIHIDCLGDRSSNCTTTTTTCRPAPIESKQASKQSLEGKESFDRSKREKRNRPYQRTTVIFHFSTKLIVSSICFSSENLNVITVVTFTPKLVAHFERSQKTTTRCVHWFSIYSTILIAPPPLFTHKTRWQHSASELELWIWKVDPA